MSHCLADPLGTGDWRDKGRSVICLKGPHIDKANRHHEFQTCTQPGELVCTSPLKTFLQTAGRWDRYCGKNWWSSEPGGDPSPGKVLSDLGRLGHSHRTSDICKTHHLIWGLGRKKIWVLPRLRRSFILPSQVEVVKSQSRNNSVVFP